jgi:radical SAM protein with 4Fe4S-binding SPASM domain
MPKFPPPFKVKLPEIYQIEASSHCDHDCKMCPRKYYHREDKRKMFDIDLLKTMIKRGDLEGSYFIELQMSGEPLLNPDVPIMIELLKSQGILVGLSTHGDLFPKLLDSCKDLDYITISVDSITKRNEIRKGSKFDDPDTYLEQLLHTAFYFAERRIPIDFQFIELKGWEKEKTILENFLMCRMGNVFKRINIRSIPDCCILHRSGDRLKPEENNNIGICLNPWLSVSVQSNGNVSSCCFAWGDNEGNVYGNLYEQSLEEIWNGEKVKKLRNQHSKGFIHLPDLCMKCTARSPVLLHWNLFFNSIRKNR